MIAAPLKIKRKTEASPEETAAARWRQRRDEIYERVKKKRSLLSYIPPIHHAFYADLTSMDTEDEVQDVEIME